MTKPRGIPQYRLSQHAATAVAEREIDLAWVTRTLAIPETVEQDPEDSTLRHALRRVPERQGCVLRVIYDYTVVMRRIMTCTSTVHEGSGY